MRNRPRWSERWEGKEQACKLSPTPTMQWNAFVQDRLFSVGQADQRATWVGRDLWGRINTPAYASPKGHRLWQGGFPNISTRTGLATARQAPKNG